MNYYNEFDPKAAEWLRELIHRGMIPDGFVDERSIKNVRADDLRGFTQCHFFAGIGGWSLALELADWNKNEPVWTGSCPCPPFSSAGKKQKCPECGGKPVPHPFKTGVFVCVECGHEWFADERHLWPEFGRLISQCRPAIIFGEQVASADGRTWFAGIRADLERMGYAAGGGDLCAAGINSPHIRQRLFWGAVRLADNASNPRAQHEREQRRRSRRQADSQYSTISRTIDCGLSNSENTNWRRELETQGTESRGPKLTGNCLSSGMGNSESNDEWRLSHGQNRQRSETGRSGHNIGLSHLQFLGLQGHSRNGSKGDQSGRNDTEQSGSVAEISLSGLSAWSDFGLVFCRDNKIRRVPAESVLFGLADGISKGMDKSGHCGTLDPEKGFPVCKKEEIEGATMLLKGYGNAIVPELGAEFITTFMEALNDLKENKQ